MFFVPFYVVWALFVFRGLGDRVRALAVLVLAAALIAPWSAWVSRLYGRFVPVSPVMWSVLIQGNNRVVLEEPRFSGYCVWYTQVPEWASEFEGKSQIEREDVAKRLLLRWLPANRDKWDDLLWNKAVRFWSPFLKQDSRLIRFAMLASWGPVLLLFVPAFFATLAADLRARSPRLWLHAFIASVFLQALIYFAFPRYRFPIEVFCLVFAALTLSWLLARLGLWPRRQTSR
jgi:hypothetical protein